MGFLDRLMGKGREIAKQVGPGSYADGRLIGAGPFGTAVVGESHYQEALWKAVGGPTPDGGSIRFYTEARLVLEPDNPHDSNAVRVDISGQTAGYLSRDDAEYYHDYIKNIGYRVVVCQAVIVGGYRIDERKYASLGVWLDLPDEDNTLQGVNSYTGTSAANLRAPNSKSGLYKGKHYTEYVEDVKALKRHGAYEEALKLLYDLIDAVEEESRSEGLGVAPWYYEQAAIIHRKLDDFAAEVRILERYESAAVRAPGAMGDALLGRLTKARALRDKHQA